MANDPGKGKSGEVFAKSNIKVTYLSAFLRWKGCVL